jgi:hypothetical protein
MVVLHLGVQGEDVFEGTNGKCCVFTFGMQEEGILEHTNSKCHSCRL